ncbi:MAG TPA: OmpA family protein [Thermoanaerobaculia bacterium]|jgi:outer membrane protein OmpA-like peptidoglycan-associated protein|nr:OmpA family protein [Thermoanaerobaculia bacterium]
MKLLAISLTLVALTAHAGDRQPVDNDPGPPYQFTVVDLVYRIEHIAGAVEDIEVKETPTEVRVDMAADVLFDFDKADLLPKADETLKKAADFVREHAKDGAVRIEGHTDAKGNDAYNQKLSERRAASVKSWFVGHGLANMKFSTEGFGAKKPVAPNTKPDGSDDPEGRQKNRRVELVIRK